MVFIIEKRAPLSKKVNKFMIDYVACLEQIDIMNKTVLKDELTLTRFNAKNVSKLNNNSFENTNILVLTLNRKFIG